jgi:hypothetical protein
VELVGSKYKTPLFDKGGIAGHLAIEIRFQAINTTPLPLTIKKIVTEISRPVEGREKPEWETFEVEDTEILKPKRGDKGMSYPFFVAFELVGDAVKAYQADQYSFAINSTIFFEPAAGGEEQQSFSSLVKCGPTKDTILPYIGKEPQKSHNAYGHKPN